jgi:hypothetical protein
MIRPKIFTSLFLQPITTFRYRSFRERPVRCRVRVPPLEHSRERCLAPLNLS